MTRYLVKSHLTHDGVAHDVGSVVEMADVQGSSLVAAGVLEPLLELAMPQKTIVPPAPAPPPPLPPTEESPAAEKKESEPVATSKVTGREEASKKGK